jgi:hypothetical protein
MFPCKSLDDAKQSPRSPVTASVIAAFLLWSSVSTTIGSPVQTSTLTVSTQQQLAIDVELSPCKNKERLNAVKSLFIKNGATEDEIAVEKFGGVENLIVRKKGKSADTIVVGAHYDKVTDGCGAIDNWTGIVALVHIYKSFKDYPNEKSMVFIAFGKEESGLEGSRALVKAIKNADVPSYCAMVNIDRLGMGGISIIDNVSSEPMCKLAVALAKRLELKIGRASLNNADTDSSSFVRKKIPAISITGIINGWEKVLHHDQDQVKQINMLGVYLGYWFALSLVDELQQLPCDAVRK